RIEEYSVPCAPETNASTGPGRTPFTTTTGILVPASTPAGTSRYPVAFCPGAAEAVPTRKTACARTVPPQESPTSAKMKTQRSNLIIHLQQIREPNPCQLLRPLPVTVPPRRDRGA